MEYQTLSLETQDIRLLTLTEAPNSEFVTCELNQVSLLDKPHYTALSYCWGDANITAPIILNGTKRYVTTNLEAALRQLRAHGYVKIWADAICINQNDLKERSHQVQLMFTIYSLAWEVVAWLGIGADDSALAMGVISILADEKVSGEKQKFSLQKFSVSDHVRDRLLSELGFETQNTEKWMNDRIQKAFEALFRRQYWSRVWIIQEIMAARRVKACCGSFMTTLQDIETALSKFSLGRRLLKAAHIPDFAAYRRARSVQRSSPLVRLLVLSRQAQATDPRDKVYGLRGLASDGEILIPFPDYGNPASMVFQEMTRSILTITGQLAILALRSINRRTTDLSPTWVPDWANLSILRPWLSERNFIYREEENCSHLSPLERLQDMFESAALSLENSSAGEGPYRQTQVCKIKGRTLRVKGIIFGVIDGLSSQLRDSIPAQCLSERNRDMIQPFGHRTAYKTNDETALAILCSLSLSGFDVGVERPDSLSAERNVTLMTHFLSQILTDRGQEYIQESCPRLRGWLDDNRHMKIAGARLESWMTSPVSSRRGGKKGFALDLLRSIVAANDAQLKRIISRIDQVLGHGMRLFVTDRGMVGMAYPLAIPGDVVCLLSDCRVALILRPSKGVYHVVGEALFPEEEFSDIHGRSHVFEKHRLQDVLIE